MADTPSSPPPTLGLQGMTRSDPFGTHRLGLVLALIPNHTNPIPHANFIPGGPSMFTVRDDNIGMRRIFSYPPFDSPHVLNHPILPQVPREPMQERTLPCHPTGHMRSPCWPVKGA